MFQKADRSQVVLLNQTSHLLVKQVNYSRATYVNENLKIYKSSLNGQFLNFFRFAFFCRLNNVSSATSLVLLHGFAKMNLSSEVVETSHQLNENFQLSIQKLSESQKVQQYFDHLVLKYDNTLSDCGVNLVDICIIYKNFK